MSMRSAARNLRLASRNASSGVGRRNSVTAMSPAASHVRSVWGAALQSRRVLHYPHRFAIQTRWKDNDVYGHVNNVEYYSYFDTAINAWLIREGGLDIERGDVIGLCVESHCEYRAALTFPETIEVGLRVGRLGKSSVRYELGIFREGTEEPAAEGHFVHVFVDRESRRPTAIPPQLRSALERLQIPATEEVSP